MDTIYIERQEINSNGSNRYFQNKTCVISSVYGPTASHLSKANLRKKIILGAHFEVILKSNKKLTTVKT
jgi:ribonuclease PH